MSTAYNLSQLLTQTAARYPDRTAIVFGESRISYAELDAASNQVANLLVSRGIEPGDKVALSCPNLPYFTIVYHGILKAGATVVPLNVLLKGREVAYHLADSEARAYFAFEGTSELPIGEQAWRGFQQSAGCSEFFLIESGAGDWAERDRPERYAAAVAEQATTFEVVTRDEDDTAVILYTSGTTGQPKGAELRHRNMRDNARAGVDLFRSDAQRPDTYLCVLPLFHSFGQTVIQNGAITFGGTIVLQPRFEAAHGARTHGGQRRDVLRRGPNDVLGPVGGPRRDSRRHHADQEPPRGGAGGSALPSEIHNEFRKRLFG